MDLKTMDLKELKSMVYDQMAQIEACQANIRALNQEIATRQPDAPVIKDKKEETKKKE